MNIEKFVELSLGEWQSMRSGHSLLFKQFEEIVSTIKINSLKLSNPEVHEIINSISLKKATAIMPFKISWQSESNWEENSKPEFGECILVPFPYSDKNGFIHRSIGYFEKVKANSNYNFLSDGTLVLTTEYEETKTIEKIWFVSKNVRCRSSVIISKSSSGILQTSFASEIRRLQI
tara:strand:+ start:155 stop:682 length:528 start_codon:yes stop_codon:yes gene_type:complete